MIKRLTATGMVAAAAAGFMLLGGAAQADSHAAGRLNARPTTYAGHHYGWSPRHHRHHWRGWGRWHHRDRRWHRFHPHH
jgi:hypothetical protein